MTCHCKDNATCNAKTGYCPSGVCAFGWSGDDCQTGTDTKPLMLPFVSTDSSLILLLDTLCTGLLHNLLHI